MACHKEPPFTAERVAWIDQRIAEAQKRPGNSIAEYETLYGFEPGSLIRGAEGFRAELRCLTTRPAQVGQQS